MSPTLRTPAKFMVPLLTLTICSKRAIDACSLESTCRTSAFSFASRGAAPAEKQHRAAAATSSGAVRTNCMVEFPLARERPHDTRDDLRSRRTSCLIRSRRNGGGRGVSFSAETFAFRRRAHTRARAERHFGTGSALGAYSAAARFESHPRLAAGYG